MSPRSGNRAQPRTSGTNARQGSSGHRGARPYRLRRVRRGIEATPASGAVAAGWPPLRAPEASASPPCTCARPSLRALLQLVGRFAALRVINGCEDPHARTPTQPRGWTLAAACRRGQRPAHAPRGPRTIGAGAMWRARAALPRTTVRHERPARHAQPSGRGRARDHDQHGRSERRCVARSSARQARGCQAARSAV